MLNSDKDHILSVLGYYQGETFETAEQVHEYLAEMNAELAADDSVNYLDSELREVAEYAIENRLHWAE